MGKEICAYQFTSELCYSDPFREGESEGQIQTDGAEGIFLPPSTTTDTTTTTTSGSGPQSLSHSQGSIGAGAGAGGMVSGSAGAVVGPGLVKYESDSLQHPHLQAPNSPTLAHHPRAHRRNVSDSSAFNKTFASETTQFLAPFEASVRLTEKEGGGGALPAEYGSQEGLVGSDMSLPSDLRAWNPFNDMTPFSQMSEDNIFGAEFDKIRRGSQSSISNVKSRESLVMSTEDDPFGAAPFMTPATPHNTLRGGCRRTKLSKGGSDPRENSTEDMTGLTPDPECPAGTFLIDISITMPCGWWIQVCEVNILYYALRMVDSGLCEVNILYYALRMVDSGL
ncbi:hypothetical protein GWK47_038669 [Chionoecetes opilio]|uniref:Uncharacterized protein n=1 Tax=Chionoecetes opilio TaxID=41210 RepID=A0A8J4YCF4_CHIOP|nr:hypothetical protein GWK47_038669 [Chionoecetes opilio]